MIPVLLLALVVLAFALWGSMPVLLVLQPCNVELSWALWVSDVSSELRLKRQPLKLEGFCKPCLGLVRLLQEASGVSAYHDNHLPAVLPETHPL
jgi:hypothetical protein